MVKALIIFKLNNTCLLFLLPLFLFGQEAKINESMLCSPVLLITNAGQGSGLFICDSSYSYFVTARHNLFSFDTIHKNNKIDTIYHLIAKSGKFIFYPHDIVKDEPAIVEMDIKNAFDNNLIKFHKEHDIAVIAIAKIIRVNSTLQTLNYFKQFQMGKATNIYCTFLKSLRKYSEVNIGSDIFLFGYPCSIGYQQNPQFDCTRPLLRKGIVAGKYERNKTIIIDSPAYFGNSGGPVWELIEGFSVEKAHIFGIVTEYIPYVEMWENKRIGAINTEVMNSGYSVVTPIEFVFELLREYK